MTKRTKILMWYWGRRGGGARYAYELCKALAEDSSLELHTSFSRQSEFANPMQKLNLPGLIIDTYKSVYEFIKRSFFLFALRKRFIHYLQNNNIDIVICPMSHIWNFFIVSKFKKLNIKYLFVVHDASPHPGEENFLRHRLQIYEAKQASGIVSLSKHVLEQLQKTVKLNVDTWIIPHGIFTYSHTLVAQKKINKKNIRLLFFGRILAYKGLELLLSAYKELENYYDNIHLAVYGNGDISPYQSKLDELRQIDLNIRWIAEDEIDQIFSSTDLVILPYREASQSGVVAIAMDYAIPCIVTPVGGLAEQIKHRETGLVCTELSVTALVASIKEIIDDEALYQHCSINAKKLALEELSWASVAKKFSSAVKALTVADTLPPKYR